MVTEPMSNSNNPNNPNPNSNAKNPNSNSNRSITESDISKNIIYKEGKVNWINLRRMFDAIKNVDEIFYFLIEAVDELKVCSNSSCVVFADIKKLDLKRMEFPLYKTLEEAKANITHQLELKAFEKTYFDYIIFAKDVFNLIYSIKIPKDLQKSELEWWKNTKIEMINAANKNRQPVQVEFQDEIQDGVKYAESREKELLAETKEKLFHQTKG